MSRILYGFHQLYPGAPMPQKFVLPGIKGGGASRNLSGAAICDVKEPYCIYVGGMTTHRLGKGYLDSANIRRYRELGSSYSSSMV